MTRRWLPRRLVRRLVIVLPIVFLLGCGQAEYDQLVNKRMAELRAPPEPAAADWLEYSSTNFAYQIEAPVEPQVNAQLQNGTEQLTMQLGKTTYQVQFVEGTNLTSLEEAAQAMQDLYAGQGFAMISTNEEDVNGLNCAKMEFTKSHGSETALVQVFFMADKQQTCAMAVVGKDYSKDDAARFLASFVPN